MKTDASEINEAIAYFFINLPSKEKFFQYTRYDVLEFIAIRDTNKQYCIYNFG